MDKKCKFISSTLPYLNSKPHIGHCFEFVLSDVIARFHRLSGYEVLFNVGVDEHGIKVQKAAIAEGIETQDYCDKYAAIWGKFCQQFQITFDNFYRTSDLRHKLKASNYFHLIKKSLVKKNYEGYYCEGCESFITEKEIVDGKCPIHLIELKKVQEENFFFNLKPFKEKIEVVLIDKSLSRELRNNIEELDEISITRQNVSWGVNWNDQVLYVWAEALTNYVFAAGFDPLLKTIETYGEFDRFKNFWKNSIIICGKDNLKFQAYILQALLLAGDLPQTTEVLVHGTILDKDRIKMSKTLGNVIDPIEQLEKWGVSPLRYYLFFGLNTFENSSYSENELIALWNSEIVNGFGNLLARVLNLVDIKNVDINKVDDSEFAMNDVDPSDICGQIETLDKLFFSYKFSEFKTELNRFIAQLNKRINDEKPYSKECEDAHAIISQLYWSLKCITKYYKAIIPEYGEDIENALKATKKKILFKKLEAFPNVKMDSFL